VSLGRRQRTRDAQARTHAERLASRDGYFAPESVIRRVANTPVTPFLGGGTAVLLQVAHPLVAAGVAEHSDFHRDLWRRLGRTLRALYMIAFGTKAEAERAGEAVRVVHGYVHGVLGSQLGCFPPGTAYSAEDPDLQLWVHATLVAASLSAYQRFERRLSAAEQESYYRDMAVVAQLFGTPAEVIPPTLAAFNEYFDARLDDGSIAITPVAREIGAVILDAPLPAPLSFFGPAHRLATAALLPPRLRREYGLSWSRRQAALLPLAGPAVRCSTWPIMLAAKHLRPSLVAALA